MLVDELDRETGSAEKLEAHRVPLLHRAFSVFLYDDSGEETRILLQQRAFGKYHSGGLWANACCSHPRQGEDVFAAAQRRVREELGCETAGMRELGTFLYRAVFDSGLTEYEYDHVLLANGTGAISPDPEEVSEVRWVGMEALARELTEKPEGFAVWAFTVLGMAMRYQTQELRFTFTKRTLLCLQAKCCRWLATSLSTRLKQWKNTQQSKREML